MREATGEAVARRTARVAVHGLGHTGLPLAVALVDAGFRVLGVDVDGARCASLLEGRSGHPDVDDLRLGEALGTGRFAVEIEPAKTAAALVHVIAVPTPLGPSGDPDPSGLFAAVDGLPLADGALVLNVSTSHPGTTRALAEGWGARGRAVGRDCFFACSPERLDPGNRTYRVENTPRLVGGVTEACASLARAFVSTVAPVVPTASPEIAEAAKLLENGFRAVNIAFVNEFARGCAALGLDVRAVVDAAATLPCGFMRFDPGPGVGGHCIPVDPAYWMGAVAAAGADAPLLRLAQSVNADVPRRLAAAVAGALVEHGSNVDGARVLLVGVAYKRDVADVRNSPAEGVAEHLGRLGAAVDYTDPHVPTWLGRRGVVNPDWSAWDVVVVITDHHGVDYGRIAREARLTIDARGVVPRGRRVTRF